MRNLTWTSEGTEEWTRNIPGIDGSLAAIQQSGGVTDLEIHDLQGDIVGEASPSETETKLLSTYNSTEFGVPTTSNPPKYSWLGADGIASELAATGVSTRNGASYVPEIGRPLQTGPIASPGSFPDGTAGVGVIKAPYLEAAGGQLRSTAIQENSEREEAKRHEAEELAKMFECPPSECGPWPEEPGEETFGDPIHCYVGGQMVNQKGIVSVFGYGGCHQGLPAGTWIKVCVSDFPDSSPYPVGTCSQIVVKRHTSRYWTISESATMACSEGDILRGYVAFFVPGGKTLYAGTEQGECGGNDESVWETLTPWQALPGDL